MVPDVVVNLFQLGRPRLLRQRAQRTLSRVATTRLAPLRHHCGVISLAGGYQGPRRVGKLEGERQHHGPGSAPEQGDRSGRGLCRVARVDLHTGQETRLGNHSLPASAARRVPEVGVVNAAEPGRTRRLDQARRRRLPASRGVSPCQSRSRSSGSPSSYRESPKSQRKSLLCACTEAGCDDAGVGSCDGVLTVDFDREAESLGKAIGSAVVQVEDAGFKVARVEVEPTKD